MVKTLGHIRTLIHFLVLVSSCGQMIASRMSTRNFSPLAYCNVSYSKDRLNSRKRRVACNSVDSRSSNVLGNWVLDSTDSQ